jgi:hypothetical protein
VNALAIAVATTLSLGPAGRIIDLDKSASRLVETDDYATVRTTAAQWQNLPPAERRLLIVLLSTHLGNTRKVGLRNTADLYIPYRAVTGDLSPPSGMGYWTPQDLYVVGGRVAWAIGELMGVAPGLPELNEGLTKEEWDRRVQLIRHYITGHKEVSAYLAERDYLTLEKNIQVWKQLPVAERVQLIDLLVPHLRSADKPGLENHIGNVRIYFRVETGDMPHGNTKRSVHQDLFIAGGRAAWAIEEMMGPLGRPLPVVTEGQSDDDRAERADLIKLCVGCYKVGVMHGSAASQKK